MLLHDKFEDVDEWDDYLNIMMASNQLELCAIYNMRGRLLASSDGEFEVVNGEIPRILNAFNHPNQSESRDVDIAGQHYSVCINDGKYGMLLKGGVRYATICKTSRVLVVGLHKVNTDNDLSSAAVMNLGDFLVTKGM